MTVFQIKFWVPLANFETDSCPIKLGTNLVIDKTSKHEKSILSDLKKKWSNITFSDFILRLSIEKSEPEAEIGLYLREARIELEKAITIFRLFKKELIGFNVIIQRYSDIENYAYSANALLHYMLWAVPDSEYFRSKYRIKRNEIMEFTNFFSEYHLPSFEKMDLSVNYFNKSYIEPYTPRDSFLDIMICLENLFLKGSRQELSYKLSMRVAHLLGCNVKERKQLFQTTKKVFGYRSSIVHSGEPGKLNEEFLLNMRDIARISLRYFILNIGFWSESELDFLILNNTFFPNHHLYSDAR